VRQHQAVVVWPAWRLHVKREAPSKLVPWGFQKAMSVGAADDDGTEEEELGCEKSEHIAICENEADQTGFAL
jgi:hypothetical protein